MSEEKDPEGMRGFLWMMVEALVDRPDSITMSSLFGRDTAVFLLSSSDAGGTGPLIGREGQNAKAMRDIIAKASRRFGFRRAELIIE